jgi:hypothetical protein
VCIKIKLKIPRKSNKILIKFNVESISCRWLVVSFFVILKRKKKGMLVPAGKFKVKGIIKIRC